MIAAVLDIKVAGRGLRALARVHDGITHLTFWVAMIAVCYLTLVTAWEVVGRYVFQSPSSWTLDTASVSFSLVTFLSAPMLTWKSGHAAMSAVVDVIPGVAARWVRRFTLLLGALACGVCAWFAAVETLRLYENGVSMITATPMLKWWVMSALVYGLVSMTLYFVRHLLASFMPTEKTLVNREEA